MDADNPRQSSKTYRWGQSGSLSTTAVRVVTCVPKPIREAQNQNEPIRAKVNFVYLLQILAEFLAHRIFTKPLNKNLDSLLTKYGDPGDPQNLKSMKKKLVKTLKINKVLI